MDIFLWAVKLPLTIEWSFLSIIKIKVINKLTIEGAIVVGGQINTYTIEWTFLGGDQITTNNRMVLSEHY
jgi:hypothetical protein